jgi:hypothetical protein
MTAEYDETYRAVRYQRASHVMLRSEGSLVAMHDTVTKVHYVGYGTLREIYKQTSNDTKILHEVPNQHHTPRHSNY